jgi:hypothetical protein
MLSLLTTQLEHIAASLRGEFGFSSRIYMWGIRRKGNRGIGAIPSNTFHNHNPSAIMTILRVKRIETKNVPQRQTVWINKVTKEVWMMFVKVDSETLLPSNVPHHPNRDEAPLQGSEPGIYRTTDLLGYWQVFPLSDCNSVRQVGETNEEGEEVSIRDEDIVSNSGIPTIGGQENEQSQESASIAGTGSKSVITDLTNEGSNAGSEN